MVKIKKVYDNFERHLEENSGESLTVQSDYIPIEKQVAMIIRGEITVGNMDDGFDDEYLDLDKESPDEIFEDAVDLGTQYQDDIRLAVAEDLAGQAGNTSAQNKAKAGQENGESDAGANDVNETDASA